MSATTPFAVIVDNACFQTRVGIVGWLKHVPNGREERNSQGRNPRTSEAKTAREGTREPVNKEEQCQQQAKFYKATRNTWKYNTWRRTEHSASSQEANDKWDNKFDQDEPNVIGNTDQKGSCLSSTQRISDTRMKPISRRSRPCGLDSLKRMCEIPVSCSTTN